MENYQSYKFEFYVEHFGDVIHTISFLGNVSEEHINNIFQLSLDEYKVDINELFETYLKKHNLRYKNIKYEKIVTSYEEIRKNFRKKLEMNYNLDNYYILYHNFGKWIYEDFFWKLSFIGKHVNNISKFICLEEKMNDYDLWLNLEIFENNKCVYDYYFDADENNENDYVQIRSSRDLIQKLINIESIHSMEDFI